jgi:hypothetical protein
MKKKDTKGLLEQSHKQGKPKTFKEAKKSTTKQQTKAEVKQPGSQDLSASPGQTHGRDEVKKYKNSKNGGFVQRVWGFFCSVKLAVIIIILSAVICGVGTMILQQKTPAEYDSMYGTGVATFLRVTQLTDVFHSYWFTALLLLLCTNLACCTIKRWRNSIMQLGFILTHLSIILILVGAVIGFHFGEKGGVNVYVGQSVDFFYEFVNSQRKPLGFSVFCDDFILEKHPSKFELFSYIKNKHLEGILSTEIGKEQKIPKSRYSVNVKDYLPDAEFRRQPIKVSDELKNPGIFVQLFNSEKISVEGWLIATERNQYVDRENDLKVQYLWAKSVEEFEGMSTEVWKQQPVFSVNEKEKGIFREFPAEVGTVVDLEGTDYKIKVAQFVLDFSNKDKPLQEQLPNNPAIQLEISGSEGSEKRWVFAKYPDWDEMHPTKYKNLKFTCTIPEGLAFVSSTLRIIQAPDGKQVLSYFKEGMPSKTEPFELGKKYNIGQTEQQVAITKFYPNFGFKEEVIKKSDEVVNPALFVEIDGPKGKFTEWVFSNTQASTAYPDGNFFLLYKEEGKAIKDFKSKLRIVVDGKTVLAKTIEVNDPLTYKGYSFYQSSYDPKGGNYTGLQVAKDPGIPVVYAGFSSMCFGIIFIFYIKPFLRRKAKKVG